MSRNVLMCLLILFGLLLLYIGVQRYFPPGYPGTFSVVNYYKEPIYIISWTGFPGPVARKIIEPDKEGDLIGQTHLGRLRSIGETTVKWYFLSKPDEIHEDTLDLQHNIPWRARGLTGLVFNQNGQWEVRFQHD